MMLSLCNFLNPFLHSMIQPAATGPHHSCDVLALKRVESRWIKPGSRAIFGDNDFCKRFNFLLWKIVDSCIYWIEKGQISWQSDKEHTYRNISLDSIRVQHRPTIGRSAAQLHNQTCVYKSCLFMSTFTAPPLSSKPRYARRNPNMDEHGFRNNEV